MVFNSVVSSVIIREYFGEIDSESFFDRLENDSSDQGAYDKWVSVEKDAMQAVYRSLRL